MKLGIFYGSTMGTTEALASQIANLLNIPATDIHNVSNASAHKVLEYDTLLLGSSTWGLGELQDDWYDFLDQLQTIDLNGKKIGLFGCGDSVSYEDTFCEALALIYDAISNTGCKFIGAYEPTDYSFTDLSINKDGKFIGLAIDDNEANLSDSRIDNWISIIQS